ncbi:MAG TPA: hypothetical protein EYO33_09810 [Phycisphaerales bacterium]|nr:hypothetical protein [Phycisphaerales bacterium]
MNARPRKQQTPEYWMSTSEAAKHLLFDRYEPRCKAQIYNWRKKVEKALRAYENDPRPLLDKNKGDGLGGRRKKNGRWEVRLEVLEDWAQRTGVSGWERSQALTAKDMK